MGRATPGGQKSPLALPRSLSSSLATPRLMGNGREDDGKSARVWGQVWVGVGGGVNGCNSAPSPRLPLSQEHR